MREALFIKKNRDRWLKNQQMPSQDPDEMARDFTQLVDDLAYAKTFYPSSQVTRYVNAQASRIYLDIYKNRKEESNRLVTFWKYDLPLTIRKHHRVIFITFLIFLVFFAIGFFTTKQDSEVARNFFGDAYYDQALQNIEKGNPFGVYENGSPFFGWMMIMINNIQYSFLVFVSGIFCGVPSIIITGKQGVMVGIFDEVFAAKGLGLQFFLVVFVHGTLEITAIIISGAAGIVLGKSYLFPGTMKRMDAFKKGAKDGVKIMVGLVPIYAFAAFFEGFITRLYNDLSILTTIIFALSIVFVIWYFIIYPIQLEKKLLLQLNEEEV